MIKKTQLLLTLLFIVFNSHAVMKVTITKKVPIEYGYEYFYTVDQWDLNDPTPNPCFYDTRPTCSVGIGLMDVKSGTSNYKLLEFSQQVQGLKTLGEVGKKWRTDHGSIPFSSSAEAYGGSKIDLCITFVYYHLDDKNLTPIPGSNIACGSPPPFTVMCKFSGNLTLNHGLLPETKLDTHRVDRQLNLYCNDNVSARISLNGSDGKKIVLRPDASLESALLINDQDAANDISVQLKTAVAMPIKISSVLVKHGAVEPGPFKGAGTISVLID